ncbi:hypothetical protein IWT25_02621 [Secundilactobacillus pentosiphilus]|uniref:Uncharacterized protein n=1 Tax=Secundilactobacillus pentosiphilus TaxID=1714682 RepID=A0A1Z5J048_9LACO|nr:hypothetical protein IWT25_02621 [Secundilactobacillus pentosiphilus]
MQENYSNSRDLAIRLRMLTVFKWKKFATIADS